MNKLICFYSGENEEGERVGWAFEFQQFPVAIVVSFIDGQSHILNAWRGDLPPDVFFNHLLQVIFPSYLFSFVNFSLKFTIFFFL